MKRTTIRTKLAAVTMAMVLAWSMTGCGASSSANGGSSYQKTNPDTSASTSEMAMAEEGSYDEMVVESPMASDSGTAAPNTAAGSEVSMPQSQGKKLIWTAYVDMETQEFDKTLQALSDAVTQAGGYASSTDQRGGESADGSYSARYASFTFRIPADQLTPFLSQVGTLGNVTSQNTSSEDISLQYSDVEARKQALQTEYDRLLELLASAESVDSVIALESRLSEVRLQLDSFSSQLRTYDDQVDYATVYLSLSEVRRMTSAPAETFTQRISTGFTDTLLNLRDFGENLVVFLIVNSPILLILALIVLLVVWLVRRSMRRPRPPKSPKSACPPLSYGPAASPKAPETDEPSASPEEKDAQK